MDLYAIKELTGMFQQWYNWLVFFEETVIKVKIASVFDKDKDAMKQEGQG